MLLHSQLVHLPVIEKNTGAVLGHVRAVRCRAGSARAEGIVYEDLSLLRRCRFLPWEAITDIGAGGVMVNGAEGKAVKPAAVESSPGKLYNAAGDYLGSISNYLLDEKTGAVLGMELSESISDDLKNGRKIIRNRGNIRQGENHLVLLDTTEERRAGDDGLY